MSGPGALGLRTVDLTAPWEIWILMAVVTVIPTSMRPEWANSLLLPLPLTHPWQTLLTNPAPCSPPDQGCRSGVGGRQGRRKESYLPWCHRVTVELRDPYKAPHACLVMLITGPDGPQAHSWANQLQRGREGRRNVSEDSSYRSNSREGSAYCKKARGSAQVELLLSPRKATTLGSEGGTSHVGNEQK